MRRTMDEGRAARHGAFVAAIVLLAAGLWVPAASGDQGGKPHEDSHGNGAQGAPGHQSAPAEQPGDESGDDQGGPAKQHDDSDDEGRPEHAAKPEHKGTAKHNAKREHAGRPEHSAPSKSQPTPN